MSKLKLGPLADDKPVRLTVELSAEIYRDLVAYAEALGSETKQVLEPIKLVAPMLKRFMATDRGFTKTRLAKIRELSQRRAVEPLPENE